LKHTRQKIQKKSPDSAPPPREVLLKRQVIQKKLEQLKEYKRLLAEEGLSPDREDKERESILIQQLLGLDKDQERRDRQKKMASRRPASQGKSKLPLKPRRAAPSGASPQ